MRDDFKLPDSSLARILVIQTGLSVITATVKLYTELLVSRLRYFCFCSRAQTLNSAFFIKPFSAFPAKMSLAVDARQILVSFTRGTYQISNLIDNIYCTTNISINKPSQSSSWYFIIDRSFQAESDQHKHNKAAYSVIFSSEWCIPV